MIRFNILAAGLVVLAAPVAAHHGWSSYDESKPITLTGSFTTATWGNPHGTATIRYQGKPWAVVLAPTSRMEARGLTEKMIAPGRKLTLTGYARRDGVAEMRIERVVVGGKTVELR